MDYGARLTSKEEREEMMDYHGIKS